MFLQSKHVMQEKQETLLDTINKLKSDVDKGKEKSAQQKAIIRDLQQVWILSFISLPSPPPPCFSFCLWQFSIPICSFVCMFVHQLISLFGPWVRLLCLWSFSVYFFSVRVSFPPHPQSPYSCVTDWWWGDTESIIIYLVCCFIFQELNETSKKLVQSETALEMQTKVFYILSSYI